MKKILVLLIAASAFTLNAQNYTFSKSTGTYSNITGSTVLASRNWSFIDTSVLVPFVFKFWGYNIIDPILVDDYGSFSLDQNFNEEVSFLNEDMHSRGIGKSIVSHVTEGTAPNRIFKLEYKNFGFDVDGPLYRDSANVQCWIYETSNIIEFRYGPNKVKSSSWSDNNGPLVGIVNSDLTKYIILEGNTSNPTTNTNDVFNTTSLNGMPASGTIYKFTPTNGSGIVKTNININVVENKIALPANLTVKAISIYNVNGQLIQTASKAQDIRLSDLNKGLYVVVLETEDGVLTQKLVL